MEAPVRDLPILASRGPLLALVTLCVFALGGCAKPYDPYQVPRAEVRSRVRTIAISPHVVPYRHMDEIEARALFEPLATERLEAIQYDQIDG